MMLRFAMNLTTMFTEAPLLDRFELAAQAGAREIEFLFPYEFEQSAIRNRLDKYSLKQVLFNLPAGDWVAGERGIAANPAKKEEFRAGVKLALEWAAFLQVPTLNCLSGLALPEVSAQDQRRTLIDNVRYAAEACAEKQVRLVVEGINHFDINGFFLNTADQVLAVLNEADHPNAYLQYDLYHAYREGEDIDAVLKTNIARIGHIQIADVPGRHQPGTGTMDYPGLFRLLESLGYQGAIGLEYNPKPNTVESLGWIEAYGYKLFDNP